MKKQILMIVLALLISAGLIHTTYSRAMQGAYADQYDAAARTLRVERSEVQRELESVERELRQVVLGKGGFVLLFEEAKEALCTEALPLMAEAGYVGVVALSSSCFPGQEGCITPEQLHYLLSHGWTTCVYWNPEVPLERELEALEELLQGIGLERPTTVCVAAGEYQSSYDGALEAAGFTIVLHHGELMEPVTREDDTALFHLGVVAWSRPTVKTYTEDLSAHGGALALAVNFSEEGYAAFDAEHFEKMCSYLQQREETLFATDPPGARSSLSCAEQNDYLIARRDYLRAEIARYDREIEAIYRLELSDLLPEK